MERFGEQLGGKDPSSSDPKHAVRLARVRRQTPTSGARDMERQVTFGSHCSCRRTMVVCGLAADFSDAVKRLCKDTVLPHVDLDHVVAAPHHSVIPRYTGVR